jgi:hypothetical protein
MGGHALKKVATVRKAAAAYERIKAHVVALTEKRGIRCCVPLEMPNKESFGDLDVLYVKDTAFDVRQFVSEAFKPDEMVRSGDVLSFNITEPADQPDLHNFQIDFIGCSEMDFDASFFYFSYGDMGGILGRMANAHGLKLGAAGLWMNVNADRFEEMCDDPSLFDATLVSKRIHLTDSPALICEFFGLDYARWSTSFATAPDMFQWICSSSLFHPRVFTSLNYEHRQRAEKRPFYIAFLKYIGVDNVLHACERQGEVIFSKQREALDFFQKHDTLAQIRAELQQVRERSAKFPASLFMEQGLTGTALGAAIRAFRELHSSPSQAVGSAVGLDPTVAPVTASNPAASTDAALAVASLTLTVPGLPPTASSPASSSHASPAASPATARKTDREGSSQAWDQWLDAHSAAEVRAAVEAFCRQRAA